VALLGGLQAGRTISTPAFAALVIYLLMVLAALAAGKGLSRSGSPFGGTIRSNRVPVSE
jgi:hypothetical protein